MSTTLSSLNKILTGVAANTIACRPWAILARSLVSRSKMLDNERSQS